jgi:hypothetical protein
MSRSECLAAALVLALSACGGKIAPPGESRRGLDAGVLDSGGHPVVEHIDPSSGPNSGGTTVSIQGAGFATDGGTQITFAGFPAAQATCLSDSECVVLSPWAGPSSSPQVVDVQVTVGGELGHPGALSSATGQQDVFTFTAGPSCDATQVCTALDLPRLELSCPDEVTFYGAPWTPQQQLAGQGTSYATGTQQCGGALAACYGEPTNGSCSEYTLQAGALQCGSTNFCALCQTIAHGVCSLGPDPLCCTAICQSIVPMPPCP